MRGLAALATVLAGLLLPAAASAALRAPALQTPKAGATVEAIPALTWSPVKGAAAYEYQLAADDQFGSIQLGTGRGEGTSRTANTAATLDETLPDGTYYWRARAIDRRDRAGRWSASRVLLKAWTTTPQLQAPADDLAVAWPSLPLVLQWAAVPYAANYLVTIATDPALSSPVAAIASDPVKTQATSFALPGTLAPGTYYWAITPLDVAGHPGKRSRAGSFSWLWPTHATPAVTDVNDAASVYDPLFSWSPVAGAASYEVEVNASHDWAPGSRICCTDKTIGTSLAPIRIVKNNVYFWRIRAFDASGNAGAWNEGTSFQKDFDPALPSIPNLRVRDTTSDSLPAMPSTSAPIVSWDPVPGASSYTVETVPYTGVCSWTNQPPALDDTAATSWTFTTRPGISVQGPISNSVGGNPKGGGPPLVDGVQYCVRVRARSDRESDDNGYISDWTQIGGLGQPAFRYVAPAPTPGSPPVPFATPSGSYLAPAAAAPAQERMPLFTWNRVPGAGGYFVVVSKDASFTTIVDYAFTQEPAYAPGSAPNDLKTYADESSHYYWVVIPSTGADGAGSSTVPAQNAPRPFDKHSTPPSLLAPVPGADVTTQPTFHWTSSEGARRYRLQVSQDPTFGDPIDDVTTASTAYTSSTTYPADTQLYWRVGGVDENDVRLDWSATGTFKRRLLVPSPLPITASGGPRIPVLSWTPVPGAVSYTVHVDQLNGTSKEFTTQSTSFTPTGVYGNGHWRWQVRANFPTSSLAKVSGGSFALQDYLRTLPKTPNVRGTKSATRVLISWDPDPSAAHYEVQVSRSSGFGSPIENVRTTTTDFAPDLSSTAYGDGGTFYWRVATIDEFNNLGAYSTGTFSFPKVIKVAVSGVLQRGQRSTVRLVLTDAGGAPVRGAKIRVTGRGVTSASKRSSKKNGTASFRLRPRRYGTVTFHVSRRGYQDAVATAKVY